MQFYTSRANIKKQITISTEISQLNFRKRTYEWDKLLPAKQLQRNQWLAKIWTSIYFKNQEDVFVRNLSTEELLTTKWFEKYGIKEPTF